LANWASSEVGGDLSPCGICKPVIKEGSKPTASRPEPEVVRTTVATQPMTTMSPEVAGVRELPAEISSGCPELDRMRQFRDRLRNSSRDRSRYERTKRRLAKREWAHVQDYADAKRTVIDEIMSEPSD